MNSKSERFQPQVPKSQYFTNYDDKVRWISYWHQIHEVLLTGARRVLEIGVGNSTVADYLKKMNIEVTTVDIDCALDPDYVCSVTNISDIFSPGSFDTILCAEVLEHLPFEYFELCMREIYTVAGKNVILSLPYHSRNFEISLKTPITREYKLLLKLPAPQTHAFDGEHYWEIGKKGYPYKRIASVIQKYFIIQRSAVDYDIPCFYFFKLMVK